MYVVVVVFVFSIARSFHCNFNSYLFYKILPEFLSVSSFIIVHVICIVNFDHVFFFSWHMLFVSISLTHSLISCSLHLSPTLASSIFFKSFHHELLSHIRRWCLPWSNTLGLFQTSPTHIKMQTDLQKFSLTPSRVSLRSFSQGTGQPWSARWNGNFLYLFISERCWTSVLITGPDWELPDVTARNITDYKCVQKAERVEQYFCQLHQYHHSDQKQRYSCLKLSTVKQRDSTGFALKPKFYTRH